MIDERLPVGNPVFKHDCDECVFLGHYEKHDLYYCNKGGIETVIARAGSEGSDYLSGLPIGVIPLAQEGTYKHYLAVKVLRVAYLIAADLGYLPFVWQDMQVWPYNCRKERDDGAKKTSDVPSEGM